MWRSPSEQNRQLAQDNSVTLLERSFTDGVLLDMVITAEADRPVIGGLESNTSIGVAADVSTLDRAAEAARNAAVVAAHPGTVSRALAPARLARALTLKPVRELESGHLWLASVRVIVSACSIAATCVWRILRHLVAP